MSEPDQSELTAKEFLMHLGFEDCVIKYEPDGNIPPDWLVNENIAVEVTRLDIGFSEIQKEGNPENISYSLWGNLEKLLTEFSDEISPNSAYVSFSFSRPLTKSDQNKILKKVKELLFQHLETIDEEKEYTISEHLEIQLFPATKKLESVYLLLAGSDDDWTGSAEVVKSNLERIMLEKSLKIKERRGIYAKWWLVLIDLIGDTESSYYDSILPLEKELKQSWDKVFCISPVDKSKWRELEFK